MKELVITLNETRNVTLTVYLQETGGEFGFQARPGMLVIPGGGYSMCSDREADPVAMAYARAGYQAFVLRYTVGEACVWPLPLDDYEQAMETILEHADEWHVIPDKIAVVGFSAGGHLAACAATIARHKPAAAVLGYPVITKEIVDLCKSGLPYPHEHVDGNTCPCFFAAARNDRTVNVESSLKMQLALNEHGIPFESHIYSYGGHGFSTAEPWILNTRATNRLPHWVDESVGWLGENIGQLTAGGMTEPAPEIWINGNHRPTLSMTCTVAYLMKQGEEVQTIIAPIYQALDAMAASGYISRENLIGFFAQSTVEEIMEFIGLPREEIDAVDDKLRRIPNQQ